jgi:CMP-N-acetylneuraminic acid synthetase
MAKNIKDVCLIVQARLGSQRVPGKMLKPFAGTTLTHLLFDKLTNSSVIPKENIVFSAHEQELKDVGNEYGITVFPRSEASANEDNSMQLIYEWHDKIPYKYCVLVSACNPLLKIETIDKFFTDFLESDKEGAFAVFPKKTYYWNDKGESITDWKGLRIMNTKFVDPVYEAAHCLYASRLDIIKDGLWMDTNYPAQPHLVEMDEFEAFDIDYPWQFEVGQTLYKQYA